jgi:hypothetical protein
VQPTLDELEYAPITHSPANQFEYDVKINLVERNGNTLPTSRAIRPRSPLFGRATRWKARHSRCLDGCGATANWI